MNVESALQGAPDHQLSRRSEGSTASGEKALRPDSEVDCALGEHQNPLGSVLEGGGA